MNRERDHHNLISFYMPHHAVIKENSTTTKLRTVFNASSPSSTGISLNDCLLVGPTVQNDLFTVLCRFRTHQVALTADLEKMYRQIKVKKPNQALQRILWRNSPSHPMQCIQLTTVTYGTASASFLATRTLAQLVKDEGNNYPAASRAITNNTYVDDFMTGADTVQDAVKLYRELTELLERGGFRIHKWCSNMLDVLKHIPQSSEKMESIITDDKTVVKALGITWEHRLDCFKITVPSSIAATPDTKLGILSSIAQIFDPLGFVCPVVTLAKILLQSLWREKLDWRDKIPGALSETWSVLKGSLPELAAVQIPRLIICAKATNIYMHGFADSSTKAYGGVVYLTSFNADGAKMTRLIAAKSRVAPIKPTTLPRLELCAAVLLAKLVMKCTEALNLKIVETTLWSDSTITLCWINSDPAKYQTFVANRIGEIQEITVNCKWRYVPTKENPADLITRGLEPKHILTNSLWWNGPSWILKKTLRWPENKSQVSQVPEATNEEKRKVVSLVARESTKKFDDFYKIFERFSCLVRLQRTFAYILRFADCLKPNRPTECLSAAELDRSLKFIVKCVQWQIFEKEMVVLSKKHANADGFREDNLEFSTLRKLNPVLDTEGLLRVGGRLKHAKIPFDAAFPILLPQGDHVTTLLCKQTHLRLLHAGIESTLCAIKVKFWPINARSQVRKCIHNCVKCHRFRAQTLQQQMAHLPSYRVNPVRPFLNTGLDYAGPINIKNSRLRKSVMTKGYICLFICMATKAIHLELVTDMTTKTYLNAFRRFVSRRGMCVNLYSDNGTTFKGAEKELSQVFVNKQNRDVIFNCLAMEGVTWNFIPPLSPHWGGLWESNIKNVKSHLRRMMGNSNLTFEELYTLLVQIEGVLNSRPLCPNSNDPTDLTAITPAHFLIGSEMNVIPEECPPLNVNINRLKTWQQISQLKNVFWKRWHREYLNTLQVRKKWHKIHNNIKVNDLVLIKEDNTPPLAWLLGRVVNVIHGKDGYVRAAVLKTKGGEFTRPITKLSPLPIDKALE